MMNHGETQSVSLNPALPPVEIQPQTLRWRRDHPADGAYVQKTVCPIQASCQTCQFINQEYEVSLQKKFADGLEVLAAAGVTTIVKPSPPTRSPKLTQYRTSAKLVVGGGTQVDGTPKVKIGLYQPDSHKLVDLDYCAVHYPVIERLLVDLRQVLAECAISIYDEKTKTGNLRYLLIRCNHSTQAIMLTFVVREPIKRELKGVVAKLRALGHHMASVHMHLNDEEGNNIFGSETELLFGSPKLRDTICNISVEISPTSFFQVNPWIAERIYARIGQIADEPVHEGAVAWDLYCGIGQIGLVLASQGFTTCGIEVNPGAIDDAKHNAKLNDLSDQCHFMVGKVDETIREMPRKLQKPEIIVANPARKGLDSLTLASIVQAMTAQKGVKFIYMSCNIESLARDLAYLSKQGLKVRSVEGFDMFPYTEHMEWLALIST